MSALVAGFGAVADGATKSLRIEPPYSNTYAVSYVLPSNKQKVPLSLPYNFTFPTNLQWDGSYHRCKVNGSDCQPGVDSGVQIVPRSAASMPKKEDG
ncbi:MAG: hypothetical protein R2867_37915 [Caldilineaceae bacterium]